MKEAGDFNDQSVGKKDKKAPKKSTVLGGFKDKERRIKTLNESRKNMFKKNFKTK